MWEEAPRIAALAVQPLLAGLRAHGIDVVPVLEACGVDPLVADDLDRRLPLALLDPLWQRAAEATQDRDFGLHCAESVTAGTFGILSYLGVASPTLRDALERVRRYFRILSDASEAQLEVSGATARVISVHGVPASGPVRHRVEFSVAVLSCYIARHIDGGWAMEDVFLEHAAPADVSEHQRIFGRRPRFGAPWSGFVFAAGLLDRPLRTGDPALCRILERQAEQMLADQVRPLRVADALRALLLRAGRGGDLSLAAAARRLGMSVRTLQRRLHHEGTTHANVVDEVRRSLAKQLLSRPEIGVGEVAAALGFSEPAAFHHAFRRWTGMTPVEFRRALEGADELTTQAAPSRSSRGSSRRSR